MGEAVLGNRYEIIRKVGDGGMAFVYEAKDKLLNRTVALKVLRPEFVDDDEFLTKFKREAEAVASLSHPNIVNVYDVGEDGKVHYIVMEFVDGKNLKEIIKDEGTLDEYTALDIVKQIAKALSSAHKKGIIHRDIKPHNILISKEGRIVKVADFGIAKAVSNSTMTNIGSIIGSVHYFSPEQAKGKYVTSNADLYSLGIVLYEMLIGKVPFRGDSPISIALQHINEEIDFTPEEKVSIPQSVRTIIKKLTEKSSTERYQSAEEVIEDIEYIEKNIDLDFIKEYDNFATKKMDEVELSKSMAKMQLKGLTEEDLGDEEEEEELSRKEKKKIKKDKSKKDNPKTRKRLMLLAGVLVFILIGQVVLFSHFGKFLGGNSENLTVPDLKGKSMDEAQKQVEGMGLYVKVDDEVDSADVPKDYIVSQKQNVGTDVKKGDTIYVVISTGQKPKEENKDNEDGQGASDNQSEHIPSFVDLYQSRVEDMIKSSSNLVLGKIVPVNSTQPKGMVVSQQVGSEKSNGKFVIDLYVSVGPKDDGNSNENGDSNSGNGEGNSENGGENSGNEGDNSENGGENSGNEGDNSGNGGENSGNGADNSGSGASDSGENQPTGQSSNQPTE